MDEAKRAELHALGRAPSLDEELSPGDYGLELFKMTCALSGERINVMKQHLRNLLTPSTPYFFNTMYDPFADDADFVARTWRSAGYGSRILDRRKPFS
jgi:hypothetical protein